MSLRFIVAALTVSTTLAGVATAMDASFDAPADLASALLPPVPGVSDVTLPDASAVASRVAIPATPLRALHAAGERRLADADLSFLPLYLLPDGDLMTGISGATLASDGTPLFAAPAHLRAPTPHRAAAAPPAAAPLEFSDAPVAADPTVPGPVAAPASSTSAPVHAQGAASVAPPAPPAGAPALAAGGAAAALAVLGFALYHRIRPHSALENDTRKEIFDAVCATPGLGVHAIAERARVSYSTTVYHLERLTTAGMIVMTPDGNKLCYYKNGGAFTEVERKILPVLKNEEAARLFEAILEAPGTYRAELAGKLGVTATTINWHLRRLRTAGLVHEMRAGRNAHLFANVDVIQAALPGLATKLAGSDVVVAERLRRYGFPVNSAGPASPA